ncbi:betaine--homocysteine S-methyltransferase 1-like isoform X3 [Ostrea edulis]|uniref:betaine--homocysteine S-methyltransferase 1-like isoform X3 n=1 Tax=Ostrea edulis TaxID=37623 RepID=UPI002095ABC9|nr:betaine--homocysteine S-methyltransferase 1-like isoform X3 [Ostrea edulis]
MPGKGLLERLKNGESLVVAEGYIFEFERRGYLKSGSFVPEVVLDHPELVKSLHEEYVHAGSDVVLAFTEQIEWAVEGGADFIVAETFGEFGEAMLALESIKQYGKGLPAVITLSVPMTMMMHDGIPVDEACKRLEDAGADVVGLNCGRGPETIIEPLKLVRKACRGPIAALPVPYRTNDNQVTFFSLTVPGTEKPAFPLDLSSCYCTREEIRKFAEECKNLGIQYVGLCCGNAPHFLREVAGVYGTPAAALKYSPEMEKHFIFGDEKKNDPYFTKTYKDAITKK